MYASLAARFTGGMTGETFFSSVGKRVRMNLMTVGQLAEITGLGSASSPVLASKKAVAAVMPAVAAATGNTAVNPRDSSARWISPMLYPSPTCPYSEGAGSTILFRGALPS